MEPQPQKLVQESEKVIEDGSETSSARRGSRHSDTQISEDYSLTGAKLHILVMGLGLAVFLMALDMSILTTAIPLITEKFHSTADIGWYMSAYSLSLYVLCYTSMAWIRN